VNGELVLRRTHLVTYPQDLLLGGSGCCPHSQLRTLSLREAAQLSGSQSQYWLLRADPELRINEGHALKEEPLPQGSCLPPSPYKVRMESWIYV
jgi:hypothetical protein